MDEIRRRVKFCKEKTTGIIIINISFSFRSIVNCKFVLFQNPRWGSNRTSFTL